MRYGTSFYAEFQRRIKDFILLAKRDTFYLTKFLNKYQRQLIINELNNHSGLKYFEWGGSKQSESKRVIISEYDIELNNESFEIVSLKAKVNPITTSIKHPDLLGALFSLGVNHDVFGDVLVEKNHLIINICENFSNDVISNLAKIKKEGLKWIPGQYDYSFLYEYKQIVINVASVRCDSIIAKTFKVSRQIANKAIMKKEMIINYQVVDNVSKNISINDRISLRGYGLFFIRNIVPSNKQGYKVVVDLVV